MSIVKNLGLVAISAFVAFLVGEGILRVVYTYPQPQFLSIDPIVGHRHRPNVVGYYTREGFAQVSINKHGFRDEEVSLENDHALRIAVLGDSYTEAFQVPLDKTFHGLLEEAYDESVEVLNFGVSGYGTAQELLAYREYVRSFEPDVVILAFNPGNDIKDNSRELAGGYPRPYYYLDDGQLVLDDSFRQDKRQQRPGWIYTLYYFLTDHFATFSLLDQLRYRTRHQPAEPEDRSTRLENTIYNPVSPAQQDAWNVTETLVAKLEAEVQGDGARFVMFVLDTMPTSLITNGDPRYPEERLGRFCDNQSMSCIFMEPEATRRYKASGQTLHGFDGRTDGHWNEFGHVIAYEILRDGLIRMDILEPLNESGG